jgi:geranylgeranyl diphosphate synthase type II
MLHLKDKFDTALQQFIIGNQGNPSELYEPINYALNLGGKRIRPLMVLISNEIFGGDIQSAMNAALAIEVFHNFTLLHDDIMDNAPLRRGKATVHEKWNSNIAILSGDTMFVQSYQLMASVQTNRLNELLSLFSKTAIEVCEGQQLDMNFEKQSLVQIHDYINMISLKTAVLLAAALESGAIVANASTTDAQLIYDYGKNIGIAFQLQDDILDVYAEQKDFGKQVAGDIVSNKKTILMLKAFELANESQSQHLMKMRDESNAEVKIAEVMKVYDELNVRYHAEELMNTYFLQAENILDKTSLDDAAKSKLRSFANILKHRVN